MTTTLFVPGLQSSGPTHWQTWLEEQTYDAVRVEQNDWTDANLPVWSARVRHAIQTAKGQVFVVAHSFGALAAIQAAGDREERIAGVFLVAPADPWLFAAGDQLPKKPLPFPVMVVASRNHPWMPLDTAAEWAARWSADFIDVGNAGHINTESGYGPWPQGLALFRKLRGVGAHAAAGRLPILRSTSARSQATLGPRPARQQRGIRASDRHEVRNAVRLLQDAGWDFSLSEAPLL